LSRREEREDRHGRFARRGSERVASTMPVASSFPERAVVLDVDGLVPPPAVSASGYFDEEVATSGALSGLRLRRLRPEDTDECVRLHRLLFPIEYEKRFYDAAVRELENIITLGAFEPETSGPSSGRMVAVVTARAQARCEDEDEAVRRFLRRDARCAAVTLETFFARSWRRLREGARRALAGARGFEPRTASFGTHERTRTSGHPRSPEAHTPYVYVLTLGVAAEYRRRGVARAMLERALRRAVRERGCAAAYLHVLAGDAGALRMYESLGFQAVGRLVDFYALDPERTPVPGKTRFDAILLGRTCEREARRSGRDALRLREGTTPSGSFPESFAPPRRARDSPLAATAELWDASCRLAIAAVCGKRREGRRGISRGMEPPKRV